MKKSTLFWLLLFVALVYLYMSSDSKQENDVTKTVRTEQSKQKNAEQYPTAPPTIENPKTIIVSNKKNKKIYATSKEELDALMGEAFEYEQKSDFSRAIEIYKEIIKKAEKSDKKEILLYAIGARFRLSEIYYITDRSLAVDQYNKIISLLENNKDEELQSIYIEANINKMQLVDKDSKDDIYQSLMDSFKDSKNPNIKTRLEEMMFSKSFDLMGENDNEAMMILDNIIERYRETDPASIPDYVKDALMNNIELAMITGTDDSDYRELAKSYLVNVSDAKPILEMLDIIKNSQDSQQDEEMISWLDNNRAYRFENWSFSEIIRWSDKIEDQEKKERVQFYVKSFIKRMRRGN